MSGTHCIINFISHISPMHSLPFCLYVGCSLLLEPQSYSYSYKFYANTHCFYWPIPSAQQYFLLSIIGADRVLYPPCESSKSFYANGLAASTLSMYIAGQMRFTTFCKELRVTALPATESTLVLLPHTWQLFTLPLRYA